jgi:hypothetical protein
MGVTGSRQAGEKTSLTVYKRHGQGPETAPTLQQDWRPQLPKERRPTSSDWASDVLLEPVWQAIKRGDESGVAYCPRLRRQHREGVAGTSE